MPSSKKKKRKRVKTAPKAKRVAWVGEGATGSDGTTSYQALEIDGDEFNLNSFVYLKVRIFPPACPSFFFVV